MSNTHAERPPKRIAELEYPDVTPAVDLVPDRVKANGRGLQAAKLWVHRLTGCRANGTSWMHKTVGCAIREYAHAESGTVYVSAKKLMEDTQIWKSHVTEARGILVKRGWLTPTGDKRGTGTVLYALTIPECYCKACIRARKVDGETPSTLEGGREIPVQVPDGPVSQAPKVDGKSPSIEGGRGNSVHQVDGKSPSTYSQGNTQVFPYSQEDVERGASSTPAHPATAPSDDPRGDNDPFSDPVGSHTAGSTTTAPRSGNGYPDDLATSEPSCGGGGQHEHEQREHGACYDCWQIERDG